ncbi:MAG: hypothetical protein ACLGH4_06500 [Actinomycetes bacterium]
MNSVLRPFHPGADGRGPWFRARPRAALAVAGLLYTGVLAVRFAVEDPVEAVSMLYVLPVALVALAFGRRAGLAAGFVALGLVALWVLVTGADLSMVGWTARLVPFVLLGWLLGDASDRLEAAEAHRAALEAAAQRHRDATEVNDTLIQGMAAAKWALEAGRTEVGLRTLGETLDLGHRLVSELMRDADMGVNGHRPPVRS